MLEVGCSKREMKVSRFLFGGDVSEGFELHGRLMKVEGGTVTVFGVAAAP